MIALLYRIYQIFIAFPVMVIMTIVTALEVGIGTTIGNGHFWGYYPGRWWAKVITRAFLLPVKVTRPRMIQFTTMSGMNSPRDLLTSGM